MANDMKMKQVGKNVESGANSPDDDYDPHLNREVPNPTSNTETLIHLLKGSLGTGILAMPEAFKNAGLVNGVVCTILIGILCTYGLHILIQCQYKLCKRMKVPLLTYPESMKYALESGPPLFRKFAGISPYIVDVFLIIYQIGICCVYVVFVAVNVKNVIDLYTPEKIKVEYVVLILLIPFLLILFIRNLKLLAPFSTLANILTFASFGIVLYYVFMDLPDISDRPFVGTLYAFPLFFGTTLFALEAVGVVIALENNMKQPKSFGGYFGVLNTGMFFIVILYVGMGFLGYWRYGDEINATITVNFPSEEVLAQSVKILYSIAIFISYSLQGYVPIKMIWDAYIYEHIKDSSEQKQLIWEYVLRIGVGLITIVLAISIPHLGIVISLFGAFCLSALGFLFPAIMEMCVDYPDNYGPMKYKLFKDIFLIIFGIIGLITGSFTAICELVNAIAADSKK